MSIIFPTETFLGYTAHPWEPSHKDAIGKEGSTKTGYWIKKWANETDRTNYSSTDGGKLDFQNMRYAVVLLNYVEAAIELNQLSDPNIYDYLDDIRDRAGMPPWIAQSTLRRRSCANWYAASAVWNWPSRDTVCSISAAGGSPSR